MLAVIVTVTFANAGMLSIVGRCHTFDGRADGYCRGEGCAAFVFAEDGTTSEAGILGSSVQHNGVSASLTAPNGQSQ